MVPEESLDRQQDAIYITLKNLMRLCENVTVEEVERAKTLLKVMNESMLVCWSVGFVMHAVCYS